MTFLKNVLIALILAVAGWLYFNFNPATVSFFPKCPSYSLLGFYCAGCGSQRAVHQLLHARIGTAADYNLLAIIYSPLLLAYFAEWLLHKYTSVIKTLQVRKLFHQPWFVYCTLVLVVLFTIVRNIPWHGFDWLRP